MKVLHVIPSLSERSGGPAAAIVPMCRALQEQGVEVLLVTTNDGLPEIPINGPTNYRGVPSLFFPAQIGKSFKYSRPLARWLATNVQRFDLAHIHAVFNHASVAAASACRRFAVPYLVRPLGTLDPWSMKQKALRKSFFWMMAGKEMLLHSAAVHYTAQAEKDATENYLHLNHGRVVPLGVETMASPEPGLSEEPYVLVLSRLHPKKGLEVLIDAFLQLVKEQTFNRWRLVIAGDGPGDHVARLKAKAASSPGSKIEFTGWVEGKRKEALLGGASLLVLPSRQENFGLCVMEAMARAVPVLVSPHVNLAEEIGAAEAGWIAPVEREALATALAEALRDDAERERRGHAGHLFSKRYSWERVAASLAELYKECSTRSRH